LARRSGHRLMVRLVKGAYWDGEIKRAQVDGLEGFPVFTRKLHTDVSYIACAAKLLAATDAVFPQFATHNALTLGTIHAMAGPNLAGGADAGGWPARGCGPRGPQSRGSARPGGHRRGGNARAGRCRVRPGGRVDRLTASARRLPEPRRRPSGGAHVVAGRPDRARGRKDIR